MFQVGELIIYDGEGVCRVEAIGLPDIPDINRNRIYYTLKPLYREGRVYIPVDTNMFMRPVISRGEAHELIRQIPDIEPDLCNTSNLRALSNHYEEFLRTHDCADLVQLIRTVRVKGKSAAANKKKLGQIDTRYMKRAEELLHGELAVAIGIPKEDVKTYIAKKIRGLESEPEAV